MRRKVVKIIAEHPGIGSVGVLKILYQHRRDGDRPDGHNLVCQLVRLARPQIALDGYRIDGAAGRGGGWRIRPVK
jgi:hypothetical protein